MTGLAPVADIADVEADLAASVALVGADQAFGMPTGHDRREVPIPPFLVDELRAHVEARAATELVFTGSRSGGPLRAPVFRTSAFDTAAAMTLDQDGHLFGDRPTMWPTGWPRLAKLLLAECCAKQ